MDEPIRVVSTSEHGRCATCAGATDTKTYALKDREKEADPRLEWCRECSLKIVGYISGSWDVQMEVVRPKRKRKQS